MHVVGSVVVVAIICGVAYKHYSDVESCTGGHHWIHWLGKGGDINGGLPFAGSIFLAGLTGHAGLPPLYNTLAEPKKFNPAVTWPGS